MKKGMQDQISKAYNAFFDTPNGQVIWDNLNRTFADDIVAKKDGIVDPNATDIVAKKDGIVDPNATLVRAGNRQVLQFIQHMRNRNALD
jgi:hypothetical protein